MNTTAVIKNAKNKKPRITKSKNLKKTDDHKKADNLYEDVARRDREAVMHSQGKIEPPEKPTN